MLVCMLALLRDWDRDIWFCFFCTSVCVVFTIQERMVLIFLLLPACTQLHMLAGSDPTALHAA